MVMENNLRYSHHVPILYAFSQEYTALTRYTMLFTSWISRGCRDEEEPSFQYECRVGLPQEGQDIEPGGNI